MTINEFIQELKHKSIKISIIALSEDLETGEPNYINVFNNSLSVFNNWTHKHLYLSKKIIKIFPIDNHLDIYINMINEYD